MGLLWFGLLAGPQAWGALTASLLAAGLQGQGENVNTARPLEMDWDLLQGGRVAQGLARFPSLMYSTSAELRHAQFEAGP